AMNNSKPAGSMCSPEHYAVAREIGADGIVLLKNKGGLLPLTEKTRKILVVGENAVKMMTVGGGSSSLKVQREVLPLDGLRANAPAGTEIKWVRGYVGDPTGEYNGVVTGQNLADSRTAAELTAEAVEAAADADVVIFVGGLNKKEGQDAEGDDRKAYDLPYGQSELVAALVKANPNLVFVNVSGNGVAMPWINDVPAVVQAWFLGSEAGNSLADVLYGRVNPSGKLPFTMPVSYADTPMAFYGEKAYPGIKRQGEDILDESYDEGIYVGYRWYDDRKIKPLFPFGHGLSYTDFGYGRLTADRKSLADGETITFSLPVTNKGQVAGAETVQLYITDKDSRLPRPVKELKGFKKVFLQPGETQTVTFTIGSDALSYFDPEADRFVAEPGRFRASAGASSADLRSSVDFDLK
ncbi:MAG: glycoside hydrolase family 3 C-terminal domain-containing protein, partial [Muribaculaceae bacterium]|nr:glycoside hydrolase family 3 C-terminal domain-containing protein [Muribaculaceae bacterium]